MPRCLALLISLTVTPFFAAAHEFWIEPVKWQVDPDTLIEAHIRVGENLKGPAFAYFPQDTRRFEVATPVGVYKAGGKIGDRPVLRGTARDRGLYVVIYVTGDAILDYEEEGKFEKFVASKGVEFAIADHAGRGLPKVGFSERYSRYAKSLMGVGHSKGKDRAFGLLTEITALANPYTDDLSDGLPVQLTYRGEAKINSHVDIFERGPDGSVAHRVVRSDANGIATIDTKPGHDYLLDSVVIRALDQIDNEGPVWETLWSSLTFHVPVK